MTDKEMFQKTFSKVHASPEVLVEVLEMTRNENAVKPRKRHYVTKITAAAVAMFLGIGCCSAAYAMDLGGIQRTVQVWIHGDQTNATLTIDNQNEEYSTYSIEYQDKDGNDDVRSGGRAAINEDGTSRPLTEEEIVEHINAPEVRCEDDGHIVVYYMNQKLDITDKFEGDYCFVQLKSAQKTLYLTVQKKDLDWGSYGYAMSQKGFVQPGEFNTRPDMSDEQ